MPCSQNCVLWVWQRRTKPNGTEGAASVVPSGLFASLPPDPRASRTSSPHSLTSWRSVVSRIARKEDTSLYFLGHALPAPAPHTLMADSGSVKPLTLALLMAVRAQPAHAHRSFIVGSSTSAAEGVGTGLHARRTTTARAVAAVTVPVRDLTKIRSGIPAVSRVVTARLVKETTTTPPRRYVGARVNLTSSLKRSSLFSTSLHAFTATRIAWTRHADLASVRVGRLRARTSWGDSSLTTSAEDVDRYNS